MSVRRTELGSGAVVVSERMAGVKSVTFGLFFPTGSRHEDIQSNGISHLLEHLLFRGTRRRDADQINREIDLLGGTSNAYTSKEIVCLHAHVLAGDLERLIELYGDLATSALPEGVDREFERERSVILQEIAGVDDAPEDLVGDLCDRAFFGSHPLGLPVVGSARAVERLDLPALRRHYRAQLVAEGLVVAAAGELDHDALVASVRRELAALPARREGVPVVAPQPRPETQHLERDSEQVHLCLSARGIDRSDRRCHALDLLCAVAGDGYSSRLFREVRDRRGLAYSIYSASSSYLDSGTFDVHASVAPEQLDETLRVISAVLGQVRDEGISEQELEIARQQLRTGAILGHETSHSRMSFIAEYALLGQAPVPFEHELAELERVSLSEVNALARELLAQPLALAVVGPVPDSALPRGGLELCRA